MNKFSWYEAKSVEDALAQVNTTVSEEMYEASGDAALFKAGGVDLLDLMKEGLVQPKKIINIRNIPGLGGISFDRKSGLKLGANVTLAEIEANEDIRKNYLALHQAVAHAATPQLRNMSTLGGNLAQRNRCWYFRSADHTCFRKGGDRCFARNSKSGQNEGHAILNNSSCVSVHASSVSTALMAFNARVEIASKKGGRREVPMEDFFVSPAEDISMENMLKPGELITAVLIDAPTAKTKSHYIKQVARESYDWSLADVAVVAEMSGKTCEKISIVLGAASPTPIHSKPAEKAMLNQVANEKNADMAANAAMEFARPLSMNAYKIPLFKSIIKTAILAIA